MTEATQIILNDATEIQQETIADLERKIIVMVGEDRTGRASENAGAVRESVEVSDDRVQPGYRLGVNGAVFRVRYDQRVVVKDIEFLACARSSAVRFRQGACGVFAERAHTEA